MRWHRPANWWIGAPWGPRDWQRAALEAVVRSQMSASVPPRVLVQAIMGAGKSVLLAELCAAVELPLLYMPEFDATVSGRPQRPVIVVSTSTRMLVDQLAGSIRARGLADVGRFFTDAKQVRSVTVACNDSLRALAAELAATNRRCVMLLVDEAHRSAALTMREAIEALRPDHTIGLTATPFRSKRGEALSAFDEVVYSYDAIAALKDGVVVPWDVHPWDGGEVTLDEASIALAERARHLGPGVFNARSCRDANTFARVLGELGWAVAPVHSKLSAEDNELAIAALKSGELEAIVHVNMLAEGVDIPQLRWMVLRRSVRSRVRFCQEVGRGLRAFPGKDSCWIGDPNDLFGSFKLSYEAVLAGQAVGVADDPAAEAARELAEKAGQVPPKRYEALHLDALAIWMRRTTLDLEAKGALTRKCKSHSWRKEAPSSKQYRLTKNMFAACVRHAEAVPEPHRTALRHACAAAVRHQLNRGALSDLLELLMAIRKHAGWPSLTADNDDGETSADEREGEGVA